MSKRAYFWELLSCALHGHVYVGVGAKTITRDDYVIVRESDGLRWHRCLRCDSWRPFSLPASPTMENLPPRSEIEIPLRGRALRDRYVLRLIAFDRALHVLILTVIAVALFLFVGHRHSLQHSYDQIMNALLGSNGSPAALRGYLRSFHRIFVFSPKHLYELGIAASFYAILEATEMVGLWFAKRWAEYLTFIATILLLPLEIDELISGVSPLKIIVFVINIAVAIYLLFAKRLFGLRGGRQAEEERQRKDSGWEGLERAMPDVVVSDLISEDEELSTSERVWRH